ncbi:MAG: polysaccharide biosynthesis tyrosine autokinase [Sedimentisphaerales bacterium]|nr:polysaccharide biosynthesis tyrosine autokinase [Sedimentisphaerales bacterium]
MDEIEKYQEQQVAHYGGPVETEGDDSYANLIQPILRRWGTVLLISVMVCAVGVPSVWYLTKPKYRAVASIRVAPIIPSVLFGDRDSDRVMPMYDNFKNDQAALIRTDPRVLQRVADDLVDKNLKFFNERSVLYEKSIDPVVKVLQRVTDQNKELSEEKVTLSEKPIYPVEILKEAISKEVISVYPVRHSELINITMESYYPEEALQIVSAFRTAYMAIEVSGSVKDQNRQLDLLENERKMLSEKLHRQREQIHQLAQEYGTDALGSRYEVMLQRVANLRARLTEIQLQRITFQAQLQFLTAESIPTKKLEKMRTEFINSNSEIRKLSSNIEQMEQQLIAAKEALGPTNTLIERKTALLQEFQDRLEQKRQSLGKMYDDARQEKRVRTLKEVPGLANLKAELGLIRERERILESMLAKDDEETIALGRKQLAIKDLQDELEITKEMYDITQRRVQEMITESKRPARISVPYEATSGLVPDKRIQFIAVVLFGALVFGAMIAFLRAKGDSSLHTPEDIVKCVGVRIIGTTTGTQSVKKTLLPQFLANDYQAICTNLELLSTNGIPNKLVITSAGIRDGKTTFAINLATSLAKSGKKVLLIDADLRKPDVRRLMNLPNGSRGLQEVFLTKDFDNAVQTVCSKGFDLLTPHSHDVVNACEFLSQPAVKESLDIVGAKYDHVIVDTPPVLACPDTLLWSKMVDGVILASFAGHTAKQDLKDTYKRLEQIGAKVLGTILNNVQAHDSYNRYGYSYYAYQAESDSALSRKKIVGLLASAQQGDDGGKDSE